MENRKEDEIHDLLKQTIARKDIERQIADLFYKLCPHVPPQLLATTVMQTLENFKNLEKMYIGNIANEHIKRCKYCGNLFEYKRNSKEVCDNPNCKKQQTRDNVRKYRAKKKIKEKEQEGISVDAVDALRYSVECSLNPELFKCSYQQSLIPNEIPSTIREQKMLDDNYKHVPRID